MSYALVCRWFSQWGEASHDDINKWFGPELTATLVMLYAAQGCSAMNLYTPYVVHVPWSCFV